jgi:hypothetical protein
MKLWSWIVVYLMIVFTAGVALYLSIIIKPPPRDHLCGVAEISPDITPAERERCRMLKLYSSGRTL